MKKLIITFLLIIPVILMPACGGESAKQSQPASSPTVQASSSSQPSDTQKPVETSGAPEESSSQTATGSNEPELSLSAGTELSAKLPEGYPSEKFPLYEDSYLAAVIELNGGYTLTAFCKDETADVISFYIKVLEGAKVTMETKTEESFTSFGTKDGYTYNLDVGKSSEMEGYKTSVVIILQP